MGHSHNNETGTAKLGPAELPTGQEELRVRTLRVDISLSSLLLVVLVVLGVWILVRLLPVVLVLVAALFIVGTLTPAVEALTKRGLGRGTSIGIVFSLLVVALGALLAFTIPAFFAQIRDLIEQEPQLRARLADWLAESPLTSALAQTLRNVRYDALITESASELFLYSTLALEVVTYGICAIFLALYIMIDRDRLRGALFALVPRTHHIRLSRIMLNLQTIVGGYIRGQVITCVLMAVFMFIVLTLFKVPNALALAVFGGLADLLPFIGVFLTMAPAVASAYTVSPAVALIVFVILMIYEEFESRVLIPMVYGRALRLPSSVVLFSLLAGATLMGIVGALLALPVAAAILMFIEELQVELPGESELPEAERLRRVDARNAREYERRTEGLPVDEAAAVAIEITDQQKKKEQGLPP